uniref:CBS domain-containing protein n=1 Tax=Musa acuminata subsp. malaccensis TaxID=214687 RepID=A0A804HXC5_MUSAM|nr:PREDICTED: CBS domain-containing protein CBSX6-like [Musa acuminata subsp. malaccensis]
MALVFLHRVIGDLTLGKPDLIEFSEVETLEAAARAIAGSSEGAIPVWHNRIPAAGAAPSSEERFVGMLNSLDVVAFLARAGGDRDRAMRTPVSEVVTPNPNLLREVDPCVRLIDALELMKLGVRCLLVRRSVACKGVSKPFSMLYNGKWLRNIETTKATSAATSSSPPSSSSLPQNNFCCLSREDVVRFLIGCLGALAPIPLSSITSLGAVDPHYSYVEALSPALEAIGKIPHGPCAIAVVETTSDGSHKILGDISAYELWKCDYVTTAWAMANLSAGQFAIGTDENGCSSPVDPPDQPIDLPVEVVTVGASPRLTKFSSRSIGFFDNQLKQVQTGRPRSMYKGRSKLLTCKHTSSLAAVMAQMLSYRATHVWVIDSESEDDILVGVVSYTDILDAVTRYASSVVPPTP